MCNELIIKDHITPQKCRYSLATLPCETHMSGK